ncbi:MAG: flagellar basal body rod modification protein [Rhizobiales bacterium 17-65-6]|nr:MAG: flagellar basal body rod modification protein [Rhizobiales bacterium 12-68-15]OZA01487.1 MAG: flagellar basal body rod modification protein [Rhizobiales bacterium 17-65-6]
MMSVSTVGSNTTSTQSTSSSSNTSTLDYNAFLQLMIAQLKNQDPTSPMETSEYTSQLAAFSQVEQSVSTNAKLDSLLSATNLQNAEALVGRTLSNSDGSITGEVASVTLYSDATVATLTDGTEVVLGSGITVS